MISASLKVANLCRVQAILAVMVVSLIAGFLLACSPRENPDSSGAPVAVRVAPAVIGDISDSAVYPARLEPRHQVDLLPLETGRIERLHVDVGSEVRQGQVIGELSHGTLDAQLEQARAALRGAEAQLASLQSTVGPNQVQAQAQLDAARATLEQLINPSPRDLQGAASAVEIARAELASARTQLDQLVNPSESRLASARADVAQAESQLSEAQVAVNGAIRQSLDSIDSPLPSRVHVWWEMLLRARLQMQAEIAVLQNLRQVYGLDLNDLQVRTSQEIIDQNRENIRALLEQIEESSTIPQEINEAMWAESSAQEAVDDAQARLRELQEPDRNAVALAQQRIQGTEASLEAALAELDLLSNPSPADLAAARAEVAQAEQALALAQEARAGHDIAAAQAEVDQAWGGVEIIKQRLANTQILAPFDGKVVKRWLAPGAVVSLQTPIVTVSSQELVVLVQVEETRVNLLREGQAATFASPAVPARQLALRVDQVSPIGELRDRTFQVKLQPVEFATEVRPGISGEVLMETQREGVVLVPRDAVLYRDNQASVYLVQNGKAYLRMVVTGLRHGGQVEIIRGVEAGETVVVSGLKGVRDGELVTLDAAIHPE